MARPGLPERLHVLVPFWGLAGGVIKILDYAAHGLDLGVDVTLWAPPVPTPEHGIHELPVARRLLSTPAVQVRDLDHLDLRTSVEGAVTLFTEPTHHALIEQAIDKPLGASLIHLVQGTRHANALWMDGMNYRLLHRPMTRIAVTPQVFDAISPIVNDRYDLITIIEGHDAEFFGSRPSAVRAPDSTTTPLRVLYATWKSPLGDMVAAQLRGDPRFAFTALRNETTWPALRNRYHAADVFLCAPGPQEGLYLPGLEAMAAEVAVVSALVGGNEVYLEREKNCLVAPFNDAHAHRDALVRLADDPALRERLVAAGRITIGGHTLSRERTEFKAVLELLSKKDTPEEP